jgi:hypothetical protein
LRALTTSISVDEYERGTAQFAHLLNSNDSFCILRKFGNEATRILLRKQVELCQLATKLDELNKTDKEAGLEYRLTTFDHDDAWDSTQQELLDKIEVKLIAYCELKTHFNLSGKQLIGRRWLFVEVYGCKRFA